MLTDEEIAKVVLVENSYALSRSQLIEHYETLREAYMKAMDDRATTRQDLRELCRAVDNIDILDLEDSIAEKTALEIEQKYGWRQP